MSDIENFYRIQSTTKDSKNNDKVRRNKRKKFKKTNWNSIEIHRSDVTQNHERIQSIHVKTATISFNKECKVSSYQKKL